LIEAARWKEGKVSFFHSALELNTAEGLARTFEAKYPGISVRVEAFRRGADFSAHRPGAGQRHQRGRRRQLTDPALSRVEKERLAAAHVPEDVAKHFPADQVDPDGMHATSCA
jgi:iron(III) transport system substrate-binding protein